MVLARDTRMTVGTLRMAIPDSLKLHLSWESQMPHVYAVPDGH